MSETRHIPSILIVDDHEENLLAVEAVLNEPHYHVVRANSGRAALRAALGQDFAVILLDVAMPDMDGYETATLLRERDRSRDTPIIFLTANYQGDSHVFRGYSVGGVDYLFKPFSPDILRSKVAVFVELFEKREALRRQSAALKRAHDELEERVRERTAALAAATATERELRAQAEQVNRLKDEFLATLSHELRTPLNAILGWTHLLDQPTADAAMTQRAIAVIKNNAVAQSQIIEDILDVSRIIGGKLRLQLTTSAMKEVVEAAVDAVLPAAEAKGITIELDLADISPIVIDRDRLQQVCWNLLSNAMKFTPKGGRVSVHLAERDDEVSVRVEDNGVGIPAEFLPRIFDRFTQADSSASRRHGGLGLGMAIVRHLTELHGGTVHAASAGVNRGSTFTVRLPKRVAPPAELSSPQPEPHDARAPALPPLQTPTLTGQRILLVDDEQDMLDYLAELLRAAGATVVGATSGGRAWTIFTESDIDVLVSDLYMPKLTGYELIQRIRQHPKGKYLPSVAVSTLARPDQAASAIAAGFDLHVGKPVDYAQLVTAIDTVIAVRRGA